MAEQMKSSGIGWIKDIPSSWEINKVKYLATEPGTLFLDGDWIESDVIEESGIRYLTTGNVGAGFYKEQGSGYISEKTFSELHCLNVYPGDLMISRLNEPIGRSCIIPDTESRYVVAVDNVILRPNANYNKKFIMYGMNADGYAEHANMIARGATMSRISRSQLGQFWLAFPNIEEQQAIADFLDKECAQIDSIAADLEKQIALLQQYKKSLITETVTKGLDKSVPMKDSGVEWTSKIPCHWEIKRFKYVCEYITDGSHFSPETTDEGYPYITAADVKGVGLDYDAAKKISQQDFISLQKAGCQPRKGDVLLVKDGATTGRIGMVTSEKPCVVLSSVAILRTPDNMDARYLRYLMESDFVQAQIQASMAGSAMPRTVLSKIINYWGITCPKEEQKEICDFLDRKCGYIETVIETKQVQQSTIQQHKKSLIYEYVTGKKRVKEVR